MRQRDNVPGSDAKPCLVADDTHIMYSEDQSDDGNSKGGSSTCMSGVESDGLSKSGCLVDDEATILHEPINEDSQCKLGKAAAMLLQLTKIERTCTDD